MDEDTIAGLGWAMFGGGFANHPYIVAARKHQEDVIRVMSVLSGRYRYESVEAAIRAYGGSPYSLYMSLAADEKTIALQRFYEALGEVRHGMASSVPKT